MTLEQAMKFIADSFSSKPDFKNTITNKNSISTKIILAEIKNLTSQSVSWNSIISNPKTYKYLLKIHQNFYKNMCLDDIEFKHKELINQIKSLGDNSSTELSKRDPKLYSEILETGLSKPIFSLCDYDHHRCLFLLSDDQLIEKASRFDSFTNLKNKDGSIHRHIKGRQLESAVILKNPNFASHFYEGFNGQIYRSLGELCVGNWLEVSGYEYCKEEIINFSDQKRARHSDFSFDCHKERLHLEILQNTHANRGSRREAYAARAAKKHQEYTEMELMVVFINSDNYYDHGEFKAFSFVNEVKRLLREKGIDNLPNLPETSILMFRNNQNKNFLINASIYQVLDYFFSELNMNHYKDIVNKCSPKLNMLRQRNDFDLILKTIKTFSLYRTTVSQKKIHSKRREEYVDIEIVKELFQKNNIANEKEWNKYAKNNKVTLKKLKIPSALRTIYTNLGVWPGWGYLTGSPSSDPVTFRKAKASLEDTIKFFETHNIQKLRDHKTKLSKDKAYRAECKKSLIPSTPEVYYAKYSEIQHWMELFPSVYNFQFIVDYLEYRDAL